MQDARLRSLPSAVSGVRAALRLATEAVHERLHHAAPFAAIADGRLDRPGYAALLGRLAAFHAAAAAAVAQGYAELGLPGQSASPARLALLDADLAHLDAAAPAAGDARSPWSGAEAAGCAYVVEGSTLGGRVIHRQLDYLFPTGDEGRRFFAGMFDAGHRWRTLCARLESYGADGNRVEAMAAGAKRTFALFETIVEGP
jgi:heme oxygenase